MAITSDGASSTPVSGGGGGSGTVSKYTLRYFLKTALFPTGVIGFLRAPITGTISKVTLLCTPAAASIVVDVWKDVFANFPPTVADTITAAALPTIVTADTYEDSTLTGWTTAVTVGDCIMFNVNSVTSVNNLTIELEITVP